MNPEIGSTKAVEDSWLRLALLLTGGILLWAFIQTLFESKGMAHQAQVMAWLAGLASLTGAALLLARERTIRLLSSLRFAVLISGFTAGALFLGLFLEGATLSGKATWLQASQLPQCLWFLSLLALLALSMVIVAWKRRSTRASRLGFLAVHSSLALILCGAIWNVIGGERTTLNLGPGDTAHLTPELSLRLVSFNAELPEPEFRLYAYVAPNGKGGFERRPKAYPVHEGFRTTLPTTGLRLEMERIIPNAVDAGRWVENPQGQPNPALRVLLGLGLPDPPSGILLAKGGRDNRLDEPLGRFAVIFRENWNDGIPATLLAKPPAHEKLELELGGRSFEWDLKQTGAWEVEDLSFRITGAFPDFAIRKDQNGNTQPYTASDKPKDPWLQLEMSRRDGRVWKLLLSARNPEVTDRLNLPSLPEGAHLRYVREGEDPQTRFVVFVHQDHKVRLVEDGRLKREESFTMGKPFVMERGLSVTPVALLERATFQPDFKPHPDPTQAQRFVHPALSAKLTDPITGRTETKWLEALGPDNSLSGATFLNGRVGLLFKPKDVEPKNLRSEIVILDAEGRELLRALASLGEPMRYGTLEIHQASWRTGEAPCSRLLILREPGRGLVNTGIWLLLIGALWMFGLKPWLKKRETP